MSVARVRIPSGLQLTGRLPAVRFSVITADDAETAYEGTYKVLDNGVLHVDPDDESQPIIRLSPAFWRQINEPRKYDDISTSVY